MKTQNQQQKPATLEEVWQLVREVSSSQKETARQMKETDRRMEETARQMKETDRRIDKVHADFNSQWGKLVESLIEGKLVELLQSRGIEVTNTFSRATGFYWLEEEGVRKRQDREIDIIAANGKEVVVVEVKTTLKPDDVKYFMKTLKNFTQMFFRYKNAVVYGAVAYLKNDAEAALFAERQGLFVIRATGDSASLINKPDFKPKAF